MEKIRTAEGLQKNFFQGKLSCSSSGCDCSCSEGPGFNLLLLSSKLGRCTELFQEQPNTFKKDSICHLLEGLSVLMSVVTLGS